MLIPDLVGQNYSDVAAEYAGRLDFRVTEEFNSSFAPGTIIEQSVKDRTVSRGFILDIVVCRGESSVQVPDLKNKTLSVAESELKSAGFVPVTAEEADTAGAVPEGLVIRTEPAAGSYAAAGSQVTVYVSVGLAETLCKVPNVVGMTQERAISALYENKLTASIVEVDQAEDKGRVIRQDYPDGYYVKKGTEVTIFVSTGKSA